MSWRRAATAPTGLICSTMLRARRDFSATASKSARNTCITPMLCAKRVWVALGYTADASPSCCSDLRRWKWGVLISSSTTGYSDTSIKLCTGSIMRTAFSFLSLFGTQPILYRSISLAARLPTRTGLASLPNKPLRLWAARFFAAGATRCRHVSGGGPERRGAARRAPFPSPHIPWSKK